MSGNHSFVNIFAVPHAFKRLVQHRAQYISIRSVAVFAAFIALVVISAISFAPAISAATAVALSLSLSRKWAFAAILIVEKTPLKQAEFRQFFVLNHTKKLANFCVLQWSGKLFSNQQFI